MNSTTVHNQHYASGDIESTILATLDTLGNDGAALTIEDLAPLDQFHTGGLFATRALAQRAEIAANDRVLDVGGGLGGPARVLAQAFGAQVTVLDLTAAYCQIGELLTERTHLTDRVHFNQGDALDLPFDSGAFDVVWTQHSSMNISDKRSLYTQFHRVLRQGGRLAIHEVTAGTTSPIHFPALWAREASMSFLMPPDALRNLILNAGFRELVWNDSTDWSLAWFKERLSAQQIAGVTPNTPGLQLLLGSDFNLMAHNHVLNMQEQRIRIIEGIFERV